MNRKVMMISIGLLTIALTIVFTIVLAGMVVFAFAHTQDTNTTPTSTQLLPDLTITSAYVSMVDGNGRCLPYYGLVVTVVNRGSIAAPDVFLAETNTGQQVGIGTINPQQSITMPFIAKATNGTYNVVVDPQNTIVESNENNNSASFSGATATPPASCPQAVLGEGTPTQFLTPSPLPPPSLDHMIINTALPQQYAIPMFTAPGDWLLYANSNPAYQIYYPSNANLNVQELPSQGQNQLLTINLPIQPGTQMINKHLIIHTFNHTPEGCYSFGNGITQINGANFVYREGVFWYQTSDHGKDPRGIFQSEYATTIPHNGFCYDILLEMDRYNDPSLPAPSPSDTSIEILLDILSTLNIDN